MHFQTLVAKTFLVVFFVVVLGIAFGLRIFLIFSYQDDFCNSDFRFDFFLRGSFYFDGRVCLFRGTALLRQKIATRLVCLENPQVRSHHHGSRGHNWKCHPAENRHHCRSKVSRVAAEWHSLTVRELIPTITCLPFQLWFSLCGLGFRRSWGRYLVWYLAFLAWLFLSWHRNFLLENYLF